MDPLFDEMPEEAPTEEAPTEEAPTEEAPTEEASAKEASEEGEAVIDWETADNPYKQRYLDSHKWGSDVSQKLRELTDKTRVVEQKVDGTYDEEAETDAVDPALQARITASETVAIEKYGLDALDKIEGPEFAELMNDPAINARVFNSKLPYVEAMKVLEEREVFQVYGTTNPVELAEKVKAQTQVQLTKEITEKVTKEVLAKVTEKNLAPASVRDLRSTTEGTAQPKQIDNSMFGLE